MTVYILTFSSYSKNEGMGNIIWVATCKYNESINEYVKEKIIPIGTAVYTDIIEALCKHGNISLHKLEDVTTKSFIQMMKTQGYTYSEEELK